MRGNPAPNSGGRPRASWLGRDIEVFPVRPLPAIKPDTHIGYAPYIDYLGHVAHLGYAVIFPLREDQTYTVQRSGLYQAAAKRHVKIKVHKLDTYRLKITLVGDYNWGQKRKVSWDEYLVAEQIELVPIEGPTSRVRKEDHEGYAPFIDKLEECGPKGYGVIYRLHRDHEEALQRVGLYRAAARRGIWISIRKHDQGTFHVLWRGTSPYTSVYHKGVRRQHVKDDEASVAARFERHARKKSRVDL